MQILRSIFLLVMVPSTMFAAADVPDVSSENYKLKRSPIMKKLISRETMERRSSDSKLHKTSGFGLHVKERRTTSQDALNKKSAIGVESPNRISPLVSEQTVGSLVFPDQLKYYAGKGSPPIQTPRIMMGKESSQSQISRITTGKESPSVQTSRITKRMRGRPQLFSQLTAEKREEGEDHREERNKLFAKAHLFAFAFKCTNDVYHRERAQKALASLKSLDDKGRISDNIESIDQEKSHRVVAFSPDLQEGGDGDDTDTLLKLETMLKVRGAGESSESGKDFFNDSSYLLGCFEDITQAIFYFYSTYFEVEEDDDRKKLLDTFVVMLGKISCAIKADLEVQEDTLSSYRGLLFNTISHELSEDIKKQVNDIGYRRKLLLNAIKSVFYVDSKIQKVCLDAVEGSFDRKKKTECMNVIKSAFCEDSEKRKVCLNAIGSAFDEYSEKQGECLDVVQIAFDGYSKKLKVCLDGAWIAFGAHSEKRKKYLAVVRTTFDRNSKKKQECHDAVNTAFYGNVKKQMKYLKVIDKLFSGVDEKKGCLNAVRAAFDMNDEKEKECLDAIKIAFSGSGKEKECLDIIKKAFCRVSEKQKACLDAIRDAFFGADEEKECLDAIKGAFSRADKEKECLDAITNAFSEAHKKQKECLDIIENAFCSVSTKQKEYCDAITKSFDVNSKKRQEYVNAIMSSFPGDSEKQEACFDAIKHAFSGDSEKQKACWDVIKIVFDNKKREVCLDTIENFFFRDREKQKEYAHAVESAFSENNEKQKEYVHVVKSAFSGDSKKREACLDAIKHAFSGDSEKQREYCNAVKNVFTGKSEKQRMCLHRFATLVLQAADHLLSKRNAGEGEGFEYYKDLVSNTARRVLKSHQFCSDSYSEEFEISGMNDLFSEKIESLTYYNQLLFNEEQKSEHNEHSNIVEEQESVKEQCNALLFDNAIQVLTEKDDQEGLDYYEKLRVVVSKQVLYCDIGECRKRYYDRLISLKRTLKDIRFFREDRKKLEQEPPVVDQSLANVNEIADAICRFGDRYLGSEQLQEAFNGFTEKTEIERLREAVLALERIEAIDRCIKSQTKEV